MSKLRLFIPVMIIMIFAFVGCANDSTTKSTTQDTIKKDTINRDAESFSEPH